MTKNPMPIAGPPVAPQRTPSDCAAEGRLIPLSRWSEYHPWPSVTALRHLSKRPDAKAWLVRVGARLAVDERAFFGWVRSGQAAQLILPSRGSKESVTQAGNRLGQDRPSMTTRTANQ